MWHEKNEKEMWIIQLGYHLARWIAVVSAVFCLIVCVLLIANYFQLKSVDPLGSPVLERLIQRLAERPEDQELREEIRALDLLARKAYFTRRWQIRTGSYLLIGGIAVLVLCLKSLAALRQRVSVPERAPSPERTWELKGLSRKMIIAGGSLVFTASLLFAFLSYSSLEKDYLSMAMEKMPQEARAAYSETEEQAISENYLASEEILRNWPFYRGPGGNGVAMHADPPVKWNGTTGEGIRWKAQIPKPGNNSPIIWNDQLFLSGADEEGQEVYCFDRHTGELLWQKAVDDIQGSPDEPPLVSQDTGYAAPTMATDGTHVCAIFPTGDLVCFDFQGNRLWARNLGVPDNHYGHSSSLIMYRDLLIVQYDQDTGAKLMAFKAATGEKVWETPREVFTSWASPIAVYTGTRPEIILSANPIVASYDPRTGRELWEVECMMGEVGPSPAYDDGMVFAANQFSLLAAIDVNTREMVWEAFDELPDAASPLAVSGYLFLPTSYGVMSCFDGKTGEVYWVQDFMEGSYSSPICAGDRVYWMDRNGVMRIFKADREYTSLGECELGESGWATPAFKEKYIYLRGQSHLFCIGNADESEK